MKILINAICAKKNAGGGFQRWGERPPPLVASFFPDSFFAIEERIGPPEGASPIAWKKLG